jgi:hypothetical protein
MLRSAVVAMVAGWLALSGCTTRCPTGSVPSTSRHMVCDDRTRECTEVIEEHCACDPSVRSCPHVETDPVVVCLPALSGAGDWVTQEMSDAPHVVDGQFTGDEWQGASKLEGLFTDVYMDYRDGRLYFLNDWRANDEGIRDDCFNYFQVRIGEEWIDLRVFGNGEVTVRRDDVPVAISADGAYGLGVSPGHPTPHTIYEFSLEVDVPEIVVCCLDPLVESSCEALTQEPMAVSIRMSGGTRQVRRQIVAGSVPRLGAEAACGSQEGICADGLSCDGARHVCVLPTRPPTDAGDLDGGAPF